ncbi:TPA: ABC transporter permease [bacterium]|nr:ABC transporter permease [bacterium]
MRKRLSSFLITLGEMSLLFWQILIGVVRSPWRGKSILDQMVQIGINTLPVTSIMAIFTGMVLAVQTYHKFRQFELESWVGSVVATSVTRELGPVLTAIVVAGRCGSSTAAELGTMKVTEQIDALKTLAVDPIRFLVIPRFLAAIVMLPLLTVFTDFVAILGGYLMGVFRFGIRSSLYIDATTNWLDPEDILSGLTKALFFGIIIIVVSCQRGLDAQGGAEGVGRATTSAVVISSIFILVSDYFLTLMLP